MTVLSPQRAGCVVFGCCWIFEAQQLAKDTIVHLSISHALFTVSPRLVLARC